ncbi:hypothetical protein [Sphingobacterium sp. 2149]|uniref:hypothetical protein n=1 Tax=Sphingobacterium sp. 2149 TaxID=2817763 RepID=UPI002857371B|nr:hypothetical protein [Sphingobacterium sp. 2149]MDR6734202.1 hypothetical protein [Sphingobacterium sp. 2149]
MIGILELPIIWTHDNECQLQDLGIEVKTDYNNTRMMAFFNINAVSPHHENGHDLTMIHANSDTFLTTMRYADVKRLVYEVLNTK